ncbi:hypothetical protein PDESU_03487 [Pontiella desulfatans]|uniref:Uncharacterized protein n=1 Tax=Pontiella desulfatans TaxID=2750659 RepID=A0A6C2U524_PONDE|nr:hypothetical protein [Pontiella desulfatans]VGO14917.1 hypothetical protein PDESU_03487 [Pontiella desulfatans]
MKKAWLLLVVGLGVLSAGQAATYWPGDPLFYPFAGPAGTSGSTAIHKDSSLFAGWADGYENVVYGTGVDAQWKTPQLALGKATGITGDVVVLGPGGEITMTFSRPIINGNGYDFAVFENGFSDTFLELGWVEVSSDGIHFCRFRNYVNNDDTGNHVAKRIYGLASKYQAGYGTPFDLSELADTYAACFTADAAFMSTSYKNHLQANYPHLDLNNITHVRIKDIVSGAGSQDSFGTTIYDPDYLQISSPGFDLDAIGVINQLPLSGLSQSIDFSPIPHQKLSFKSVALNAVADSGLPVSYAIQSGTASVTDGLLYFGGTGTVEIVASQEGNATYASASSVLRSFIVAEEIQHIFVEPIPNQFRNGGTVQVNAYSSSGLPVKLQVQHGPDSALIGEDSHLLDLGTETGAVTLHAFQQGNASVAPAEDVFIDFEIVEASAANAPIPLSEWLVDNSVPAPSAVQTNDVYGRPSMVLEFSLDRTAAAHFRIIQSTDLVSWANAVPEILDQIHIGNGLNLKLQLPCKSTNAFFRLQLEAR